MESVEWKNWEKEVARRMRTGKYKGVYDVDECREIGVLSEKHWKSFVHFIRKV